MIYFGTSLLLVLQYPIYSTCSTIGNKIIITLLWSVEVAIFYILIKYGSISVVFLANYLLAILINQDSIDFKLL